MKNILPLFILVISYSSMFAQGVTQDSTTLGLVETMPYFEGCAHLEGQAKRDCSDEKVIGFIRENLRYPQLALEQGVRGQVIVSFKVNEEGLISDEKVLRDIGVGCGTEALRVLRAMPDWEPATKGGEQVSVKMALPIRFNLKEVDLSDEDSYRISWGDLYTDKATKEALLSNSVEPIIVRDIFGNEFPLQRLDMQYTKGRKHKTIISVGDINADMRKRLRKVKKGGTILFQAMIENEGQLLEIKRVFEVI